MLSLEEERSCDLTRNIQDLKDGIRKAIEDMGQPPAIWLWQISCEEYKPVGVVVAALLASNETIYHL